MEKIRFVEKMMFRILITVSISALLLYIILFSEKDYTKLFTNPFDTWKKESWKKTLIISFVVLFLMFQFIPLFSNFIEENIGETKNPSKDEQVQITEKIAQKTGSLKYALLIMALVTGILGVIEEPIFRGVLMDFFSRRGGVIIGFLGNSTIFSAYHLISAGNLLAGLPIYFVAGLIFSYLYWRGGLLASGIVHFGWNFGLLASGAFGFSVCLLV